MLLGMACCGVRAQPSGWSLPTPALDLSAALIPYPRHVQCKGGVLRFTSLVMEGGKGDRSEWLEREWRNICCELGLEPPDEGCSLTVRLVVLPSGDKSDEGYSIDVSDAGITLSAAAFPGFFNALQTFRQLVVKTNEGYEVAKCTIRDEPAFAVRGIMLDVGRNYVSPSFIKEVVRRLSRYKFNMLHLHLTDDPGWRIESKTHPELTSSVGFWETRQPGKFYTQDELKDLADYCAVLNIRVLPEVDMPGHSAAFRRTVGVDMQTERGMRVLKEVLDETVPLFSDPWFHIGSDEVHFKRKDFMPAMIRHVRDKGKEVVVWSPGFIPDSNAIRMCWGENEAGYPLDKSARYIDCNGFYLDWMDSQAGVPQIFFQQPCEVPRGNDKALGGMMCVWTDGALSSEWRLLEQYPFYPCALTFAERIWRGAGEKRKDLMAQLPAEGTEAWKAFSEFEARLVCHRDRYFHDVPFAYVKQAHMKWNVIGAFDHKGRNDKAFGPEFEIKDKYVSDGRVVRWQAQPVYGGVVQIRSLYDMFNAHRGEYKPGHWPTLMSPVVGTKPGTCYALTYIRSPKDQEVWLMFGLNGMWGHSGGYRSGRAPAQGSWDYEGGDVWLNDERISPPHWPFESLAWTGWGQGRIEVPLTWEGYFFRPPVRIHLRKGLNKVLVRSVSGAWKGDAGDRKWQFCCVPVLWDGLHYREVEGLEYVVGLYQK